MSFQFERVWRCIRAMRTLVRSLSCMTTHMTFQFRQFHTRVITFRAFVWLFMRVTVSNMSHKLAGRCKRTIAKFAAVWFGASVCIDMILQGGDRFETTFTNGTLVWSVIAVGFHMTRKKVTFARGVVAVVAHVRDLRLARVGTFLDDSNYISLIINLGFVHFFVKVIHLLVFTLLEIQKTI